MSFERGSVFACNPATTRLTSTKLGVDAKGEKIVYVNGRTVVGPECKLFNFWAPQLALIGRALPYHPQDPTKSVTYSQHTQTATVARISPSGYYCASADVAGNVRIWDIAGTDQVLKLAARPLGGRVNDLAWDGESKRIIAVGDGRERFGAAFLADSGSSCGEIQGSSKVINAVSIRHQRPFRAVTASDDGAIVFFNGVPFKHDKIIRTHTNFVQDVRFSHSGDYFASVGSDRKLFFYEGKTGGTVGEVDAHSGSILACSWSPDSKYLSTASADGTVKLWDVETRKNTTTFTVGGDVASQQNGNVWASENAVVSLSLDGILNVFDPRDSSSWRKIHGPTKAVTAATLSAKPEPTFFTGSFDGSVRAFDLPSGEAFAVLEQPGEGQISGLAADSSTGEIWASTWTDGQSLVRLDKKSFAPSTRIDASLSAPKDVAADGGVVVVGDAQGMTAFRDGKTAKKASAPDGYSAVAVHGDLVAYAGSDKKVHLESLSSETGESVFDDNRGEVNSLTFSPDGKLLAAGDSSGRIVLIDAIEKKTLVSSRWTAHTGRVQSLAFSPDGLRLVSGGLDESIYIHHVKELLKKVAIKNSHAGGVTGVAWQDDQTVISTGSDACVRTWTIKGI
ncbi:WD40 repeat-like protein [Naganishia albida]|nr:WD40 repeat-like protein [Naganishia albida]